MECGISLPNLLWRRDTCKCKVILQRDRVANRGKKKNEEGWRNVRLLFSLLEFAHNCCLAGKRSSWHKLWENGLYAEKLYCWPVIGGCYRHERSSTFVWDPCFKVTAVAATWADYRNLLFHPQSQFNFFSLTYTNEKLVYTLKPDLTFVI